MTLYLHGKYEQILRKLRIRSHLLKESSIENFMFMHCIPTRYMTHTYSEPFRTSKMQRFGKKLTTESR